MSSPIEQMDLIAYKPEAPTIDQMVSSANPLNRQEHGNLVRSGLVLVVGATLLSGCWSWGSDSNQDDASPASTLIDDVPTDDTLTPTVFTPDEIANAPEHDNASLLEANNLCGGNADPEGTSLTAFGYKTIFLTEGEQNKNLAKSMADVHVTDAQWGMGEAAFAVYRDSDQRRINGFTIDTINTLDVTTTDSEEMDVIIEGTFSVVLPEDLVLVNGDCRNVAGKVSMPSPDVPLITLKKGSSVEVLPLTMDLYNEMIEAARENGDTGIDSFYFIDVQLPVYDENGVITGYKDGKAMVIASNGCDNPARKPKLDPKPPIEDPTITGTTTPGTPGTNPPGTPGTNPPGTNPPGTNPPGTNPPGTNPPVDGRKADVPNTQARPAVTATPRPPATYGTVPATAPADPTPPNIIVIDTPPPPKVIQEPDQPMTPNTPPTTARPASEDVVRVVTQPAGLPAITVEITPVDTLATGGGTTSR